MTAISFDQVRLSLGKRVILSDVSFAIRPGEFIGLLGPNGAGKTTLIRAILGLVAPSRGTIRVMGAPASRGNRAVGYMPQHRKLASGQGLTGWDFVASAVGGWRWGLPTLNATEREDVAWALDTVEASGLARRPLGSLSGGERQRLLISQALLGRPKLLLLDEPLISLDPHHQQSIVDLVMRLQRQFGMAVLFSAHELNPLLNAIDRVLYLGQGRAVLGDVETVVTAPILSSLYGSPIEVLRLGSRIFVMSGGIEAETGAHQHDHDHDHDDRHGHDHHAAHGVGAVRHDA
ncbi:metal ABC transporter ATP-binding protein [Lichenihabitans psoromatis]|uniref:metal ABC transporter ATP-binding protein n=1 Tax=Lichenihabitans psoromatis TaxID=2528642 RepID=UPI001AECF56C|nr:ATP-binding cassette domain-containing protein [Lichenihabitans psoromatis]